MREKQTSMNQDTEIKLTEILIPLWRKRVRIIYIVVIFTVIGVLYAFLQQEEYTAESIFIPQTSAGNTSIGNKFGGLASLAGIDLNDGAGSNVDFPPSLYPRLLENIDFQLALLNSNIYVSEIKDSVSYREYYDDFYKPGTLSVLSKYTIGIPFTILAAIKGTSESSSEQIETTKYYHLSSADFEHIKRLKSQLVVKTDMKAGFVMTQFTMNDASHAAQMAGHLEKLIHEALINYRLDKINQELDYLEETYSQKREEFVSIQNVLAEFKDSNLSLTLSSSQNELNRLENDYEMAFDIFKEVATALEQKRIEKSKNTPLIKTIQPIVVPFRKSAPNRPITVILFMIMGFAYACLRFLIFPLLKEFKSKELSGY